MSRLHECEIKLRLQQKHRAMLDALTVRQDTPPAVLARRYMLAGMYEELRRLGAVEHLKNDRRSSHE